MANLNDKRYHGDTTRGFGRRYHEWERVLVARKTLQYYVFQSVLPLLT